ncbi:MAG: D-2-hydroxyacid dehydrogenase [Pirellulaceae bacterium]
MNSPPTVALCYPVEDRHLQTYAELLPEFRVVNAGQEGINDTLPKADFFVGHAKVPVDWNRVVDGGRLKLIQSSAAGLDHCLVPPVIASDIPVCSASGLFADQVAEQCMSLLLGLIRSLPVFFQQSLSREFVRRPTDDLRGKRVGIVGFGGNGRRIAETLAPFKVSIQATDYYPVNKSEHLQALWGREQLHQLAENSDILILAIPLNAETHHLINERVLERMPAGSYLINVARGQVVDEAALVSALESNHLKAAGLDVTEVEPLPENSPLWNLPNVLISPHVGAQSARRVDDSTRLACINLRRFLDGKTLFNVVDKKLGFPRPEHMACTHPDFLSLTN